ncbi:TonB family protein [Terriglobus sp. ADX1]|uniref:TonB family protein n=1 Tax=Terriglobus sp. ADX1 TaxID=2794063 RepID=UPI002FE5C1A0
MANPFLLQVTTYIASYLMNALWQVPLLFIAGWLVARLLRRMGPAAEHRVWQITLLLCVCVPAIPAPAAHGGQAVAITLLERRVTSSVTTTHSSLAWRGPVWMSPEELDWMCGLWAVTVLYGAARLGMAMHYTRRLRSSATACSLPPAYAAVWQECLVHAGRMDVIVLESSSLSSPVTVSLGGDAMLLPSKLVEQISVDDFRAAVAHECAHIARNDFWNNLLFGLLTLTVAFHPVMRLVRRSLVATREMACDRAAAKLLGNVQAYRGALLRLAAWIAGAKASQQPLACSAAVGILDSNSLEERMNRLTKSMTVTSTFTRYALTTIAVAFFAAVTVSATTAAARVAPEIAIGPVNVSPLPTSAAQTPPPEQTTNHPVSPKTSPVKQKLATTARKVYAIVPPPKLVYMVNPEFPKEFHTPEFSGGECVIGLVVEATGIPNDVHVVRSLGKAFDDSALKAVQQYRFQPAMREGHPVAVALNIAVNFQKF